MNKRQQTKLILVLAAAVIFAACTKKKKSDEFQSFGGVSYNAAPKSLSSSLGLSIAVQPMDINFDGAVDGLYVCRSGGVRKFTVTAAGTGYVNSPQVNILPAVCTTTPVVHTVVANGKVERVEIVNPGAGCTGNPIGTPSITGGTGAGASVYASGLSGGKLTRVSVVNKGAGYQAPAVGLSGGGGSGMTAGVNVAGGAVAGVYVVNPGDGLYSSAPNVAFSGGGGSAAAASVSTLPPVAPALPDFIATELQPNGTCQVSYDPTNVDPDKRHIPQMLFTWPVTPTIGLDVNGDGNADYYLYTDADGSSQVMTNPDGSGAAAKLIVKNPLIDQTNDYLYANLPFGYVLGFDILNNNTLSNNILGKIGLDRHDAGYANSADPISVASPIRNDEAYASPVDINVICSDSVACNAITYSLWKDEPTVPPAVLWPGANPDFGSTNVDPTGTDLSGTKHAIKVGDSGTIPFQSLPYGTFWLKYLVRDAAGRMSSGGTFNCVKWNSTLSQWERRDGTVSATGPNNCIFFSIGARPVVTIAGVTNRYTSQPANTTAQIQWYAEVSGGLSFRYIVVRGSCYGYTRQAYFDLPATAGGTSVIIARGPGATGGLPSGSTVTTTINATDGGPTGLDHDDTKDHGTNYITICAITCTNPACNGPSQVSVWGDAYETVIRDDTAPSVIASPLSGLFSTPQRLWLSGSVTTGLSPDNGPLLPTEICYTWGADPAGNPLAATTPANPTFPCPSNNWTVSSASSGVEFNVGCAMRSDVTNPATDPSTCTFTPGIYYVKYIAKDAAGNVTPVQLLTYAIGVTPNITTITPTQDHVWDVTTPAVLPPHDWGHTANGANAAGINTRPTTTWAWQTDFPGYYEIRINSTNCQDGTLSTAPAIENPSGTAAPLTTITSTIYATNMGVQLNDVKVCLWASGTVGVGTYTSASRSVWNLQPKYINASYTLTKFNVGDTIDLFLSDIFTPINAIRTITFSCPAGSTGPDANSACTLPTPTGAVVNGTVVDKYTFPNIPANRVTTLAFDVTITTCSTAAGCVAASGPSWTSGANGGTTTVKVMILQDKTANNAIYLNDLLGSDAYNGLTPDTPKKSFAAATGLVTASRNAIYATAGTYCAAGTSPCANGTINLPSGASLYGGFSATTWYRPNVTPVTGSNVTILDGGTNAPGTTSIGTSIGAINSPMRIDGVRITARQATPSAGIHYNTVALRATAGTSALTLFKAEITALNNNNATCSTPGQTNPGGGSYGFYSSGFTGALTLTSNRIEARCGWVGIPGGAGGATGGNGTNGTNGTGGIAGCSICGNNSTWRAPGGTGGNGSLGAFNRGGNGGSGGQQEDGSNGTAGAGQAGAWGEAGPNGGGGAGAAGMWERDTPNCDGENGGGGGVGGTGATGGNGAAPGAAYGQITGGYLAAYLGNSGGDGGNGMGGGGGGGGAGVEYCLNDGGGGGGGGGGGASQGTGGEGGYGGGPSVSVYLNAVGSATIDANTFIRSAAGNAGSGKTGGGGGTHGTRGTGASRANDGGAGGNGGDGGDGGAGGHGSGGNGGSSIGFVLVAPSLVGISCGATSSNTFSGGSAGSGGSSSGNAGSAGYLSSNGATNQAFRFNTPTTGAAFTCN